MTTTMEHMHQGLDHLCEFQKPMEPGSTGAFVKWVTEDMMKEEGGVLDPQEARLCRKLASRKAVTWFKTHLSRH